MSIPFASCSRLRRRFSRSSGVPSPECRGLSQAGENTAIARAEGQKKSPPPLRHRSDHTAAGYGSGSKVHFMGRKISQAADRRDQKPSILPPKGGTTHSQKPARPSPKNLPTNKIFLPHIPRLGADGFHPSHSHRPARAGPARRNHFPINKTTDRGQEDCMGRKISPAADSRDQNPALETVNPSA